MAQRWEARTIGEIRLRRLTFAEFCVAPIPKPWLNRKDSLAV